MYFTPPLGGSETDPIREIENRKRTPAPWRLLPVWTIRRFASAQSPQ